MKVIKCCPFELWYTFLLKSHGQMVGSVTKYLYCNKMLLEGILAEDVNLFR